MHQIPDPLTSPVASESADDTPTASAVGRIIRGALLAYCAIMIVGLVMAICVGNSPNADRERPLFGNIFYVLFAEHEPIGCALQLVAATVLLWLQQRGVALFASVPDWARRRGIALIALLTLAIAAIGTFVVYQHFTLSLDEYCADFQAAIFTEGKIAAPIPAEWHETARWLKPGFVVYDREKQTWMAPYLPVYAAMRAVFRLAGASWLLNPVLAALSIVAIAGAARKLWPESQAAPWLAAAFLASSPQFLITAMSAYSMPAHLALNLVWLWLYTRQDRLGMALAPLIGLAAVGLHQPNVHLLFALPFGVRLLWQRRWGWAAYYALAYVAALLVWIAWWRWVRPGALADSGKVMSLPQMTQLLIQPMNFVLIFSWISLAAGVLALVTLRRWQSLPPIVRDLAWGCILTFVFHIGFNSTQGHGWGYRYFHATLGSFVLLGVAGWAPLCAAWGEKRARTFVGASVLITLLVLFPIRAFQTESIIRPFADADAALRSVKAGTVLITPGAVWYGSDLLRNDPFLRERPLRAFRYRLGPEQLAALRKAGPIADLSPAQLARFGLIPRKTNATPKPDDPDSVPK